MLLDQRESHDARAPSPERPASAPRIIFATNDYYSELYAGVVEHSRKRGWLLEDAMLRHPGFRPNTENCAGVVACVSDRRLVEWIQAIGCPVVRLADSPLDLPEWPAVEVDGVAKGRLGAQHLLDLGEVHFAYYRFHIDNAYGNRCREAFIEEIRTQGRSVHSLDFGVLGRDPNRRIVPRPERIEWLSEQLRSLPRPLAVMASNDYFAVDLVLGARAAGLRIPHDIAILGAENQPFARGVVEEEISSIDMNFKEVALRGCELLDHLLQGAKPGSDKVPVLVRLEPKEIVQRQSTATFTCDHPGVLAAALFIRENFQKPITVAEVAAHAGLPARTLQTLYPEKVGRTIKDDILRRRLKTAETLLERTNLKLGAVAIESGFRNDQYLCHVFQTKHGVTPLVWRRQHRSQ